jgi:transcriptional regulator with GAF, ATPase, and Fis domain
LQGLSYQLAITIANIIANEQIEKQLDEIRHYKQQLEEENLYLQEERNAGYNFSEIIGAGTEMQKIFRLVSQVAPSDATVLLMGETGTGKELIARAIHNASPRKDKLMVKVNCATLPPNLIESELFGHEKGSFTGASERRIGKFELANNSTLFLDEIGELPTELQVKLLRALQEKEIERIGGRGPIKVNVRIIAATNRNLQKEADAGRFRSDLFYRLNVFPVTLPPLRNRKEDIPVLTTHFIARYARIAGKKINNLSPRVMESLLNYSWPGNVRELEHLVERSVLLTTGSTIKQMHLPSGNQKEVTMGEFTIVPLDEMERTYILKVLKACKGRISGPYGAAIKLRLPSTTLISKMQKLGIKKEHFHEPL